MKRLVVIGIALIARGAAFATVFPDADGSHDFASAAAWGGELPADAEFTQNGNLKADADASFGAFTVNAGAQVTFDLLAVNAELESKKMQLVVEDKKLVLKVRSPNAGMMILLR